MEIRSHLTTVVWTNEVHRLLTIVFLVKQRTVTRLAKYSALKVLQYLLQ